MKKIVVIDGGPRKNMNTAAVIRAFADGVESVGKEIEVKVVRLYELNYKGCVSCLACKVKGSKFRDVCAHKDDLTDVLRESAYADGLVMASPIYFSQITAQLRAYIERLIFPWLSYNDYSVTPPKRIPTAVIYTMNLTEDRADMIRLNQEHTEGLISMALEKPERIEVFNTLQVKNYALYDMAGFSVPDKMNWHELHWTTDLQNAADAGRRMAERIINNQ